MVSGEANRAFDDGQYQSYTALMRNWGEMQLAFMRHIWAFYKSERQTLGFDINPNADYPLIETIEELSEHIMITGIAIPYEGAFDGARSAGILFSCSWDEENGVGIRLLNEKIYEVGFQHVAI